ncbi:hypothetical protein D3C84_761170 [compost metagenome]
MLPVQTVEAEQLARRDDHLMRQQALEHPPDIDLAQRTHPDRCPALWLDKMQGIAQALLQQLGHLTFTLLEQPSQYQQVLIDAAAAI